LVKICYNERRVEVRDLYITGQKGLKMSKSKLVVCENHGVRAILLEEDFAVLASCSSPEQAFQYGVHWYVFMTINRMLRGEDYENAPISSYQDFDFLLKDAGWEERCRYGAFFVPFSNGPTCYKEEKYFIFPLTELLFRAANV